MILKQNYECYKFMGTVNQEITNCRLDCSMFKFTMMCASSRLFNCFISKCTCNTNFVGLKFQEIVNFKFSMLCFVNRLS